MTEPMEHLKDQELVAEFVAEARRYLERIAASAGLLASGQFAAAEGLAQTGHSLRGPAGALGLHQLADAAAALESIGQGLSAGRLAWHRDLGESIQDFLLATEEYCDALAAGGPSPHLSPLAAVTDRLEDLAGQGDESDEISELLKEEARDCLAQMSSTLRELMKDPSRRNLLEAIRRPAHTLKGSAATAGYSEVSALAHGLEDLLESDATGQGPLPEDRIQLILDVLDGLEDLLVQGRGATRAAAVDVLFLRMSSATEDAAVDPGDQASGAALAAPSPPPAAPRPPAPEAAPPKLEPALAFAQERPLGPPELSGPEPPELDRIGRQPTAPSERLLRIPASGLDDAMRVAGESLVHRATFKLHFSELREIEEELVGALSRLGRLSRRLETEYEAQALTEVPKAPLRTVGAQEFDSLEMDRYTEIHLIGRELAEAVSDVATVASSLHQTVASLDGFQGRLGRLLGEMQDSLGRLRMVPFSQLQTRLFRAVRTAEKQTSKRVDFHLEAAGVELDKNVLEELAEPLLHVLRNAVDHGIEPPALRRAAGKSERGRIRVTAAHQGTQIEVVIEDDGGGLDLEALKVEVVQRGLLPQSRVETLTDEEAAQLAFLPRVSTAGQISQLSGRGIGLDVMRTVVDRLRGSVSIASKAGQGSRLTLRLPMTLASLNAVFVVVGGELFGIPRAAVQQITRLNAEDIKPLGEERVVRIAGETIPLLDLPTHLGLPQSLLTWPRPALLVQTGNGLLAVSVDSLAGSADVVVKPLGPLLSDFPGFMGATLSGDGSVVLLIDPTGLSRSQERPEATVLAEVQKEADTLRVLVVDDSLTVRRILTRLVEARGWAAFSARDGLEALEAIQGGLNPDVLLLDIEMPRMDGYELTSLLRANERHARVPIVMLTSRAGQKHRAKAESLGVEEYLVKPYAEETLVAAIRRVADR